MVKTPPSGSRVKLVDGQKGRSIDGVGAKRSLTISPPERVMRRDPKGSRYRIGLAGPKPDRDYSVIASG